MSHHDHTVIGIDMAKGQDQGGIYLLTRAPVPDSDIAAIYQILEIRGSQITQRGHTAQADAEAPASYLPRKVREYVDDAIDDIQRGKVEQAQRKLLKAAALILAAVARLKSETTA